MTIRRLAMLVILASEMLGPPAAYGSGHGPVYGLATPTLGQGGWSLDLAAMVRENEEDGEMAMIRPMVGYGITEDLQISFSVPVPLYRESSLAPERTMAMMPGTPDHEILVNWRFHRQGTAVGSRFESTALAGVQYPTDSVRAGVRTAPGVVGGVVTGYASRSIYAWAGGLYQRAMNVRGLDADHPGDLALVSLDEFSGKEIVVTGILPEDRGEERPRVLHVKEFALRPETKMAPSAAGRFTPVDAPLRARGGGRSAARLDDRAGRRGRALVPPELRHRISLRRDAAGGSLVLSARRGNQERPPFVRLS